MKFSVIASLIVGKKGANKVCLSKDQLYNSKCITLEERDQKTQVETEKDKLRNQKEAHHSEILKLHEVGAKGYYQLESKGKEI